jgi:hypothetical protein
MGILLIATGFCMTGSFLCLLCLHNMYAPIATAMTPTIEPATIAPITPLEMPFEAEATDVDVTSPVLALAMLVAVMDIDLTEVFEDDEDDDAVGDIPT